MSWLTLGWEESCYRSGGRIACETVDLNFMMTMANNSPWLVPLVAAVSAYAYFSCIKGLGPNEAAVVTGLYGQSKGVLQKEGANLKAPWPISQIKQAHRRISLKTKQEEATLEKVKTSGGPTIDIPIKVEYRVVDPESFVFNSEQPVLLTMDKISRAVKNKINDMNVLEVIADKNGIPDQIKSELNDTIKEEYGIEICDVIVDEPVLSEKLQASLDEQEFARLADEAAEGIGKATAKRIVTIAQGIVEASRKDDNETAEISFLDAVKIASSHDAPVSAAKMGANVAVSSAQPAPALRA